MKARKRRTSKKDLQARREKGQTKNRYKPFGGVEEGKGYEMEGRFTSRRKSRQKPKKSYLTAEEETLKRPWLRRKTQGGKEGASQGGTENSGKKK